ncbi:MAG: sialidase family protein [Actinomycetota bacterium]
MAIAQPDPGEVTVGSADDLFSGNKQNEPAVAVNPIDPLIVAAGANDNIDLEACNVGPDNTCPFTPGVGLSGVQFSINGGTSWIQPTYAGYSARACDGVVGNEPNPCTPDPNGEIGTLPNYTEFGMVSNGDPWLAWGPRPGPDGFSWENGARLYYANLASEFPGQDPFQGPVAIAVSRTDDIEGAIAGENDAWFDPVIASKQVGTTFSDKEAITVDNASSSPFFGNAYVCNVAFRSLGAGPEPVMLARSTDGGDTWRQRQITSAANTGLGQGRQGCTVRTDSDGVVYLFFNSADKDKDNPPLFDPAQLLTRSFDGGRSFERPFVVADVQDCGLFDPVQVRLTFDGVAGSRTNSFPSVDIANGSPYGTVDGTPTGDPAPDTIAMTWCDGPTPSTTEPGPNEEALIQFSNDQGETWTTPVNAAETADRPDFPAVGISPDGTDVYLAYDAFLQPWQPSTLTPARNVEGVVRRAEIAGTTVGAFTTVHRGPAGDNRGSSANGLTSEFFGDYNFVSATFDFAVAVWNDVREAADCPAVDTFRQNIADQVTPNPRPEPNNQCVQTETSAFGNSDIFGIRIND